MTPEHAVPEDFEKAHHVAAAVDALGGSSRPVDVRDVRRKLQRHYIRAFLSLGLILVVFAAGVVVMFALPWPSWIRIGGSIVLMIPFLLVLVITVLDGVGYLRRGRKLIRGLEHFGFDACPACGRNSATEVACCQWRPDGRAVDGYATSWRQIVLEPALAVAQHRRMEMLMWAEVFPVLKKIPWENDGTVDFERALERGSTNLSERTSTLWTLLRLLGTLFGILATGLLVYWSTTIVAWLMAFLRAKGW